MNEESGIPASETRPSLAAGIIARVGTVIFFIILQAVILFSGPYRFVRHPGYVGFILQSLGTPILLGSLWALIPGLTAVVLIAIRTAVLAE